MDGLYRLKSEKSTRSSPVLRAMAGWKSALGALGLTGKGEPVAFEFTLYIRTLTPWPSDRPLRRLALRWTRGNKARSARSHAGAAMRR